MTTSMFDNGDTGRLTAFDFRSVSFGETKGVTGRLGYDEDEVDAFVLRCGQEIDGLAMKLKELEAENAELRSRPRDPDDMVLQSVTILSSAQQTADATVKNADDYSGQVMAEARHIYADAKVQAKKIVDEAHRLANEKVQQATSTQDEVERQTMYLRTLRDSMHVQLTTTLEGIIKHVTTEFGKASPAAAEAAAQPYSALPGLPLRP